MALRNVMGVLLILVVIGGVWTIAQEIGQRQHRPGIVGPNPLQTVAPTVIAGPDFGFRVESTKDNVIVGRIVVRIDGKWTDAQVAPAGVIPR